MGYSAREEGRFKTYKEEEVGCVDVDENEDRSHGPKSQEPNEDRNDYPRFSSIPA